MSFVQRDDVIAAVEPLIQHMFFRGRSAGGAPFRRIPFDEAMEVYGSDKPDLRYGAELKDVTSWATSTDFKIFRQAESAVKAIVAPDAVAIRGRTSKTSR